MSKFCCLSSTKYVKPTWWQWRTWPGCSDVQASLNQCCSPKPIFTFCHAFAYGKLHNVQKTPFTLDTAHIWLTTEANIHGNHAYGIHLLPLVDTNFPPARLIRMRILTLKSILAFPLLNNIYILRPKRKYTHFQCPIFNAMVLNYVRCSFTYGLIMPCSAFIE